MKKEMNGKVPPQFEHVLFYFQQKGVPDAEARDFFLYYESKNWCNTRGKTYSKWKDIAHRWIMGVYAMQPWLLNRRQN